MQGNDSDPLEIWRKRSHCPHPNNNTRENEHSTKYRKNEMHFCWIIEIFGYLEVRVTEMYD